MPSVAATVKRKGEPAAVVGVPDDVWVERVHAEVVLKEGHAATTADLIDYCKERLARYKAPKSVEIVKALPKSPQGKILKREIRQKYWHLQTVKFRQIS